MSSKNFLAFQVLGFLSRVDRQLAIWGTKQSTECEPRMVHHCGESDNLAHTSRHQA